MTIHEKSLGKNHIWLCVDFDEDGGIVGIDVQHASKHADMHRLMLNQVPFKAMEMA